MLEAEKKKKRQKVWKTEYEREKEGEKKIARKKERYREIETLIKKRS